MTCLTTEQAILKTMESPEGQKNAFLCYYEWDVGNAYRRFVSSEEWLAVLKLLSKYNPPSRNALDLGAGNGIASYALEKAGYLVTALEPDPSELVGYGAMKKFKRDNDLHVFSVSGIGEFLPFKDQSFGLVYCRQVLHHAVDLTIMMKEINRVLLPGGIFVATREHVVDDENSKEVFLKNHPLHKYTHSEGAFSLDEYKRVVKSSGFRLVKLLLSKDSVINFYPNSNAVMHQKFRSAMTNHFGTLGLSLSKIPVIEQAYNRRRSSEDHYPGRMISFVAKKF